LSRLWEHLRHFKIGSRILQFGLSRSAEFYDLLMAMRFDRDRAQEDGAWSLLSRMASSFKAEDDRDRGGLKSWEPVAVVKARHPDLSATVVLR
jgi:hypothetical protein